MKKLKLSIENLNVKSFVTEGEKNLKGTVVGNLIWGDDSNLPNPNENEKPKLTFGEFCRDTHLDCQ